MSKLQARMKILKKTLKDLRRQPLVDMYRIERFERQLDLLAEEMSHYGQQINFGGK